MQLLGATPKRIDRSETFTASPSTFQPPLEIQTAQQLADAATGGVEHVLITEHLDMRGVEPQVVLETGDWGNGTAYGYLLGNQLASVRVRTVSSVVLALLDAVLSRTGWSVIP